MLTGTVQWTAQERVIHGKPAAEAVRADIASNDQEIARREVRQKSVLVAI